MLMVLCNYNAYVKKYMPHHPTQANAGNEIAEELNSTLGEI